MPRDARIKKVMVIGSGPIVIGQAAEFDYAGTQACRVLKAEGLEIVLVNSNPATIMTDKTMADAVYIEPLTLTTVKRIVEKERPDSILSGLGGQTGLTLCMQMAKVGFLDKMGVRLLGSPAGTIDMAEDRLLFKEAMRRIGQPIIPSAVVNDAREAVSVADELGYPVVVRPAFTLGGTGGGMARTESELVEIALNGLLLSPIKQILVEKSVEGWKEIEFELMRDASDEAIIVCSMENFDPVGIHTGDSIVVAPAVSLDEPEMNTLRAASLAIIRELKVEGGCNIQFALEPYTGEYAVIEVNPRVSRSSALASKASGYPIAKVSTKIAIGYRLHEIVNPVTGVAYAANEPVLDYIAVKFPKWPFDKFAYANKELGTQMKATGEVMSLANSFEAGIMKAVRGAEIGAETLSLPHIRSMPDEELKTALENVTDERLFLVYEALRRGYDAERLHAITRVNEWFLSRLKNVAEMEYSLENGPLTGALYHAAKRAGFTDRAIAELSGLSADDLPYKASPVYKPVSVGAGETSADTPYFYSEYDENAASVGAWDAETDAENKKIVVLGSGPIRIGQGIEFDYACVHCVWTLRGMGYEAVVINNNPETVSTDFDTADRLYFEPPHIEDVMHVIRHERPLGVIVAFGGGTAIKLTQALHRRGVRVIGTSADSIDVCEDRKRFDKLLEDKHIKRPKGLTALTVEEAAAAAGTIGYPALIRPSYVLGGQQMIIAYNEADVREYMQIILRRGQSHPILIDEYMNGIEIEVDAICDGERVLIPGIMRHVERTGVHSGDSIAVYPARSLNGALAEKIFDITKRICLAAGIIGPVNMQYIIYNDEIYVIEVNPRASRTVPYISKITGVPVCELAAKVSLGAKLTALGYAEGILPAPPDIIAVKVPVFSFEKLTGADTHLGPEMKSTGEVLGISGTLEEALYKGLVAAGYKMDRTGGVLLSVRGQDQRELTGTARKFADLGFKLYATPGTAAVFKAAGLACVIVNKIRDNAADNALTLLESGKVNYIVSTSSREHAPARESVMLRRKACMLGIPCVTSLDTARALAGGLLSGKSEEDMALININAL